eukprot:7213844-Alexandrium_andersonii.AAC.1
MHTCVRSHARACTHSGKQRPVGQEQVHEKEHPLGPRCPNEGMRQMRQPTGTETNKATSKRGNTSVSYTHLTLPTICSV